MRAPADHLGEQTATPAEGPRGPRAAANTSIVRTRLFLKYIALFVAVVSVALIANSAFEVWFSYQEQKTSLVRIQREQAQAAAGKIEQFIQEIESQVGWTTQLPWSAGTLEQRRFDALRLLRQVPAITELAEIDATGHEQLRVSRLAMDVVGSGVDVSKEPAFTEAVAHKVYYGPVYFRRESEPYMTLSLAGTRRDAGVSIAQVNLKLIEDVLAQIKSVGHARAYVVDAQGRLIAHPDISLVLRNTDMSRLEQVRAARAAVGNNSAEQVQEANDIAGQKVLTAYAPVAPLGWLVFVETPIEEAYAPLYASIERTGLVLLGALALAFIAGMFLAGRMVVPIQALRAGAARIGAGDLSQRIAIKTGDEVEALADQFNDMAGRLQESYAGLERKVELRTHELTESLAQQTATADVLRVISSSPGDLKPVFDAILANAVRICGAEFGNLALVDGDGMRRGAMYNAPTAFEQLRNSDPRIPLHKSPLGRLYETKKTVNIGDLAAEPAYAEGPLAKVAGARAMLGVPMLKDDELIGALVLYRMEAAPFTDKQVELLTNFAAQAVIAIENARLLTELRESLARQTATSEVLSVISSSPGDLKPVFDAMLANAARLCEAQFGNLLLHEDGEFRFTATYNVPAVFAEHWRRAPVFRPSPLAPVARAVAAKDLVHVVDIKRDPAYLQGDSAITSLVDIGGARTVLVVPMIKDAEVIGALTIFRQEVRPFTDKQIDLVKDFAAQAVIAIENARLLSELRESLAQQTATAEVLSVISSSHGDHQPVFAAMLENAVRICGARFGNIYRHDQNLFHLVAAQNTPPALAEARRGAPQRAADNMMFAKIMARKASVQVPDVSLLPNYLDRSDAAAVTAVELGGVRTALVVPMLKENDVIGAFSLFRDEVLPFDDKQVALVTGFANQAVIAIENARLLAELRKRTDELGRSVGELR
ncbi:MAG: GAF domain-containing protein, partial [Xanthobacteraceae bacterium]